MLQSRPTSATPPYTSDTADASNPVQLMPWDFVTGQNNASLYQSKID